VSTVSGNSVTLKYHSSQVLVPGVVSPIFAAGMSYKAYIFDTTALSWSKNTMKQLSNVRLNTVCGLAYASSLLTSGLQVVPISLGPMDGEKIMLEHSFHTLLQPNHEYNVVMVATCDSNCLRKVTKLFDSRQRASAYTSCSDSSSDECRAQSFIYTAVQFATASKADTDAAGDDVPSTDSSSSGGYKYTMVVLSVIFVLLAVAACAGVFYYYRNIITGKDVEYEVTMDSSSSGKVEMTGSGSPFHSGSSDRTGSLSFPSDRPAGGAQPSSNIVMDIFGKAVAGVNDFIGSLGSKGPVVGGNVARPYGEISVNRSGAAGGVAAGASSPVGKGGIFGSRATSFLQASAYKRVEEDDDEDGITEINL
jgi:hypothetical protein